MTGGLSRRLVLSGSLALAGCHRIAQAQGTDPAAQLRVPPLRQLARFPLGVEIIASVLDDPDAVSLLLANFSQITPGLEMKMERILQDDGSLTFGGADAIADFTHQHGLRLHGHNLIWYIYRPPSFTKLRNDPAAFAKAYRDYIMAVAGRYRGRVSGWDVVNEPVNEDGDGYRNCLWTEAFGIDYVARAFDHAREADPDAILFLNEYYLESRPRKLASFLRLVEMLLKQGAPLGGLGTQLHMNWDQDPAGVDTMMRELTAFGLPIHVSELDVSIHAPALSLVGLDERLRRQAALIARSAEAFERLPPRQRYAFTIWGLRDSDSWLRNAAAGGDPADQPVLFDERGHPKLDALALAHALQQSS